MSDVLHKDKLEEAYELLKGSDPRWVASIVKMTRMACGKGKDYGNDEDNLANLTACKSMGIEPWVGTTIRMRDKEKRIDSFLTRGELENESLEDAIWDSAVYGVHRGTLYDEGQREEDVDDGIPPFPWDAGDDEDVIGTHVREENAGFYFWALDHVANGYSTMRKVLRLDWRDWHKAGCPVVGVEDD